jgi:hypothetical protein
MNLTQIVFLSISVYFSFQKLKTAVNCLTSKISDFINVFVFLQKTSGVDKYCRDIIDY